VYVYVRLLIDLNVTLEKAVGNAVPAMSRIITLMCYLPLITGVGNGYYKLKLDMKTKAEADTQYQREQSERQRQIDEAARIRREQAEEAERVRQAQLSVRVEQMRMEAEERTRQAQAAERLEKYRLRMATNGHKANEQPKRTNGHRTTTERTNGSERAEQIRSFVRNTEANEQRTPGPTEIANALSVSKSYASETLQAFLKERKSDETNSN
jgi:hypothetical protein